MNWSALLKKGGIVGGELEIHNGTTIRRGRIAEVILYKKNQVRFELSWIAEKTSDGQWKKVDDGAFFVLEVSSLGQLRNGLIFFNIQPTGLAIIFPTGTKHLDPSQVKGL